MNHLIEIMGDVWLLSEIICIALDEPEDAGGTWMVSIRLRGENEWQIYDMDSHTEAASTHLALVGKWGARLASTP